MVGIKDLSRTTRLAIRVIGAKQDLERIPIASLVMTRSELEAAISNIIRGHPAMTEGPVEVVYLPRSRRYQLVNGYHRMVNYLLQGASSVTVTVQLEPGNWRLPERRDRFVFQPDLPYKGLEAFIEPYMLRRL